MFSFEYEQKKDKKPIKPNQKTAKKSKINSIRQETPQQNNRELKPTLNTIDLLKKVLQQLKQNKPKQLEKLRSQIIDCIKLKDLLIYMEYLYLSVFI